MVKKKGKSKRVTLKDKYKIQKRVVESHRKARKQAKRDNKSNKRAHNKPKDPGIPNSWPFKRELLDDIARSRELVEANKKLARDRKQQQQQQQQLPPNNNNNASNTATSELRLADEKRRAANGDKIYTDKVSSTGRPSLLDHLRELRKVIRASDVLLQVLDARDPIGTRIPTVLENHMLSSHSSSDKKKRMILILNKADLVPKNALSQWLTHLRKYHPTLAIKSVTNPSSKKATKNDGRGGSTSSPPHKGVGVKELLQLLKNHAHHDGSDDDNNDRKSCITVGIIGYPNVGKSSILNSLKRCCVATGDGTSRPGHTNTARTIQDFVVLDKHVRFLNSPGLVVCQDDHVVEEEVVGLTSPPTMSGTTVDSMKDPISAVRAIVTRCNAQSLMMWYSIPAFDENDVHAFLTMISKRNGTERKGGIPDNNDDKQSAARMFLKDWNTGKIRHYTPPPPTSLLDSVADTRDGGSVVFGCSNEESAIVSVMDSRVLAGLPNNEIDFVKMEPTDNNHSSPNFTTSVIPFLSGKDDDDDSGDEKEEEESEKQLKEEKEKVTTTTTSKTASLNSIMADAQDYDFTIDMV